MTDEARERFLRDLQVRGLLSAEEAETARRLVRQAEAEGRTVSMAHILIQAGAEAAKAHHAAEAFEQAGAADTADAETDAEAEPVAVTSGLELLERIGRGSQAVVYRCRQVEMDRIVAVKILHPRAAGEAAARERFLR